MSKKAENKKTPDHNEVIKALWAWRRKQGFDENVPRSCESESIETKALRNAAVSPHQIPEEEVRAELNSLDPDDYDRWFIDALLQRKKELVKPGFGDASHPTTRLFKIGIESIRQGKPSKEFLHLLERIADKASENDVMTLTFPEEYPRQIKNNTVNAAQRDIKLVKKFKEFITQKIEHREIIRNGKEGIDADWSRVEPTFASIIKSHKSSLSPDEQKALDRALERHGSDILELRTWARTTKE